MYLVKDSRLEVGVKMMVCLGFNLGEIGEEEGLGYGPATVTHLTEEGCDKGLVRVTVEF